MHPTIRQFTIWHHYKRVAWRAALLAIAVFQSVGAMAQSQSGAAENGFAWRAQKVTIDFASSDGERQFGALVQEAHERVIIYLDWTLLNTARTDWGRTIGSDDAEPVTDEAICEHIAQKADGPGGIVLSGKPDRDNNHLLFEMTLDLASGAPFARARCEYAQGGTALRLRGFFYVTNIGTATAENLEFKPVSVPAHRVPEEFLEHLG